MSEIIRQKSCFSATLHNQDSDTKNKNQSSLKKEGLLEVLVEDFQLVVVEFDLNMNLHNFCVSIGGTPNRSKKKHAH